MRIFWRLIPAIFLSVSAWAQLTPDQKVSDFLQLAGLYAKNYAPYEWKKQVFGFDLYDAKPWLDQIKQSKTDIDFYDICVRYVASLQDSHDEVNLPSVFSAYLHFDVDIYDGKVLVEAVDRMRLPLDQYSFGPGDEVVSVDGVTAAQWIDALIPYSANGSGSVSSQRRLAADGMTYRTQFWNPRAAQIGDSAMVVIQSQTGDTATYTIPWDKYGVAFVSEGPVPSISAMARKSGMTKAGMPTAAVRPVRASRAAVSSGSNPWGVWTGAPPNVAPDDPPPAYMQALKNLDNFRGNFISEDFPFDTPFPVFDPPAGFRLRLGAGQNDMFLSGTFRSGSHTFGLIRIPTMSPASTTLALRQFATEIAYFQQNTDGLVIDIMRNGGGSGCYSQQLAQYLIPSTFRGLSTQVRATLTWVASFSDSVIAAQTEGAPQWVIDLYTAYLNEVQQALQENRGLTGPLPACGSSFDTPPAMSTTGASLAYTKPIVLLTDTFTLSSAEVFAMLLQDAQRATIVGTRTDGGGGSVVSFSAGAYSEMSSRVTVSLITRAQAVQTPGFPSSVYIENAGIYPDVMDDYMTLDNLLNHGKTFFNTATNTLVSLLNTP